MRGRTLAAGDGRAHRRPARSQPPNVRSATTPSGSLTLQSFQARGLRIVFSSNIVTSDMRVRLEPRARTPRAQLDEILAPHGLVAREGPGGILQIVRAPSPPGCPRRRSRRPMVRRSATLLPLPTYKERITVTSPLPWWEPTRRGGRNGESSRTHHDAGRPGGRSGSGDPVDAARRARGRLPQRVRGEGQPLSSRSRCRRGVDVVAAARAGRVGVGQHVHDPVARVGDAPRGRVCAHVRRSPRSSTRADGP